MIIDFDNIDSKYIQEALAGCFTKNNPLKGYVFGDHRNTETQRWKELKSLIEENYL